MRHKIEKALKETASKLEGDGRLTVDSNELKGTIAQQLIRDKIFQI
jgi:hypothetical protein